MMVLALCLGIVIGAFVVVWVIHSAKPRLPW